MSEKQRRLLSLATPHAAAAPHRVWTCPHPLGIVAWLTPGGEFAEQIVFQPYISQWSEQIVGKMNQIGRVEMRVMEAPCEMMSGERFLLYESLENGIAVSCSAVQPHSSTYLMHAVWFCAAHHRFRWILWRTLMDLLHLDMKSSNSISGGSNTDPFIRNWRFFWQTNPFDWIASQKWFHFY